MAFTTSTVARWAILSSSAVTPSGLCRVGIEHRRRIGGQRGVAVTGSSSDHAGASFRASTSFLCPPMSSRMAGFPRSGWGQQLSSWAFPGWSATLSDGPRPLATTWFAPRLDVLVSTVLLRPQCAGWCAWHARHCPGPLGSGGITLPLCYYGPMRGSCGLQAPSTLVS